MVGPVTIAGDHGVFVNLDGVAGWIPPDEFDVLPAVGERVAVTIVAIPDDSSTSVTLTWRGESASPAPAANSPELDPLPPPASTDQSPSPPPAGSETTSKTPLRATAPAQSASGVTDDALLLGSTLGLFAAGFLPWVDNRGNVSGFDLSTGKLLWVAIAAAAALLIDRRILLPKASLRAVEIRKRAQIHLALGLVTIACVGFLYLKHEPPFRSGLWIAVVAAGLAGYVGYLSKWRLDQRAASLTPIQPAPPAANK